LRHEHAFIAHRYDSADVAAAPSPPASSGSAVRMSRRPGAAGDIDVVIVTGASSGIGLDVCRRFATLGARIGMVARDQAKLDAAAADVPGTVCCAAADVADRVALSTAFARVEVALGPPTVLVNCAGHGHWASVVDTDPADFRRAIEVNYLGSVHATGLVLPGMLARGRGRIVNVASIAGRIGAPFEAAYSASKFALVGYSEALSVEVAGTGVTVSLVEPGPVDTEFFARRGHPYELRRPRPVPPAEVADAVVAAARSGRRERFVPAWLGAAYVVKTLAPRLSTVSTKRLYERQRRELKDRFGR
jgi:short-subunit dehydrogenase